MTSLLKARYVRIAGLAVGAVAVAGAAVVVTASAAGLSFGFQSASSSPTPSSTKPPATAAPAATACGDFMKHFAVEIGKTQAQINTAFQKAIADTLADEVKSGQITQAQADAIKQKLANQTPCTLPNPRDHKGTTKPSVAAYMQQYLAAAASALSITQDQLTTDLKSGQSLSQIAAAQHVSEADFRTRVIAKLQPVLDQAVKDKKLTADQEAKIISGLKTGPLPLWNAPPARPKPPITTVPVTPSPKTV